MCNLTAIFKSNCHLPCLDWATGEPNFAEEDCAIYNKLLGYHWADLACYRIEVYPLCERYCAHSIGLKFRPMPDKNAGIYVTP